MNKKTIAKIKEISREIQSGKSQHHNFEHTERVTELLGAEAPRVIGSVSREV